MTDLNPYLLHIAIGAPLIAAVFLLIGGRKLAIGTVRTIAFVGFALPAVLSIWLWSEYSGGGEAGYAFMMCAATGLEQWGIRLTRGLNGMWLPLFVLGAVVGLALGLDAMPADLGR